VTNLKHAGSLTTSTSSAGWESDNFEILLAGGEERVFFFPGKLNIKQDWRSDTRVMLSRPYGGFSLKLSLGTPE